MVRAAVSRKWNMLYSPANTPNTMATTMIQRPSPQRVRSSQPPSGL